VDDDTRGRGEDEVPRMLQGRLAERGVDAASVEIVSDERKAVDRALQLAGEDDLVVVFGDNIVRCWKQIINFKPDGVGREEAKVSRPVHSFVEEDPEAFSLRPGTELIADERGVRIARHDEEGD
jgi:cyanophycin synthetase